MCCLFPHTLELPVSKAFQRILKERNCSNLEVMSLYSLLVCSACKVPMAGIDINVVGAFCLFTRSIRRDLKPTEFIRGFLLQAVVEIM